MLNSELAVLDRHLVRLVGTKQVSGAIATLVAQLAEQHVNRLGPVQQSPICARMGRAWELSETDRLLLVVALAPELDASYSTVFAALGGATDHGHATLAFAQQLLPEQPPLVERFRRSQPFGRMPIVQLHGNGPAPHCALVLADDVLAMLLGEVRRDHRWQLVPRDDHSDGGEAADWARERSRWVVALHGPTSSGRADRACDLAAALGYPALVLDAAELTTATAPVIARDAAWHDAVIVIRDITADQHAALRELADRSTAPIVVTGASGLASWLDVGRPTLDIVHARLDVAARARGWERELTRAGLALDPQPLAARYSLTRAPIAAAIRLATQRAASSEAAVTAQALTVATRAVTRGRISELATPLSAEDPDALVLPRGTRRELDLATSWMQRGFGAGNLFGLPERHLSCLFHGPPGTGKTLAARVLAGRADLDAYRVDLSQVISKYIGETEKNLGRIFDEAEAAHALLFFDEADALFARRIDVVSAHDRFANIESGYLLQRLEAHRGPVILATNLVRNIEPAMMRRLQIVVEFPMPGVAERLAIWERCLPGRAELDLPWIAERFALAGANIRDAAMTACVMAGDRVLAMRDLVLAVWRELRRAGRVVEPRELGPWAEVVRDYIAESAG